MTASTARLNSPRPPLRTPACLSAFDGEGSELGMGTGELVVTCWSEHDTQRRFDAIQPKSSMEGRRNPVRSAAAPGAGSRGLNCV